VGQSALLTFNDPRFFHPTPECDGVVFEAPCLGVTTSNSRYPRSELRELVGGKEARWNVGTGTHTMIITQAITHLPAVKREVVAGQIHDADDDVVMIRLEGRRLLVSPVGTILDSAHELGTRFTVKLVAGGGRIKVFHDDMSTPRVDIASAAVGCYFKAGVYTQSNTTTGDAPEAYGQVVIYDLQVSHQ
jgi:poly(beta-D-mannuronate) lyase